MPQSPEPHVRWTRSGFLRDPFARGPGWVWQYPSGRCYDLPMPTTTNEGNVREHDFVDVIDTYEPTRGPSCPTNLPKDIQGTINMKRTFFVNGPNAVLMSHTCEDISTELMVERADARLTGQPLDVAELMTRFPSAAEAARQWGAMKAYLKRDSTAVGIYIMVTEHEPTMSQMMAFALANPPVPVNK